MFKRYFIFSICIISVMFDYWACIAQERINIDELIDSVFTDPPVIPDSVNRQQSTSTAIPQAITPKTDIKSSQDGNLPPTIGCKSDGECIPYYLCSNNGTVIVDGVGLIDIRFDSDKPRECYDYLHVCCATGDTIRKPEIVTPRPTVYGCGYRNADGVGFRITGNKDNEAEYGEFPWMVAILKEETTPEGILNVYECGGSLIHRSIVLTAAHCVRNKDISKLKVRAGEWDTQRKSELHPDQDRLVKDVVWHPDFYSGGLYNDIALLFVSTPFDLAPNVQPICLPPKNANFDGSHCFATGWGKDVFGQEGKYQVILKKIDLPIVSHQDCQRELRATRLGNHFELHSSFVCAGGEPGKDTCKGDGGSPLVCPIKGSVNRYYQVGIVAWGIGCGDAIPAVYVNVPYLRNWIDDQMNYHNIGFDSFTP